MSRATLKMRAFAARLIALESPSRTSAGTKSTVAFPTVEKLRPHLATLMGNTGFCALLSRSLVLAGAEVPWLRTMKIRVDGTLVTRDEAESTGDADEISEGQIVLLAQLLGLLEAFIGENLTLRLVGEAWPESTSEEII